MNGLAGVSGGSVAGERRKWTWWPDSCRPVDASTAPTAWAVAAAAGIDYMMMTAAAAAGTSAFEAAGGFAEIFEFLEKYIFRFPIILTLLFSFKNYKRGNGGQDFFPEKINSSYKII